MSSADLENYPAWTPRSSSERILMHLKMHGPASAAQLGAMLGASGEAARQHLVRLAEEGLVAPYSQSRGVGRPTLFWQLTAGGQKRFPDTHADLTVDLLRSIRAELGEAALERIVGAREARTLAAYRAQLDAEPTLPGKVARLAAIRSAEGYMADWEEAGGGAYRLYENHCPICAAATECQKFCRAEREIFQAALGPQVAVERVEHIVSGARRCAYAITPIPAVPG